MPPAPIPPPSLRALRLPARSGRPQLRPSLNLVPLLLPPLRRPAPTISSPPHISPKVPLGTPIRSCVGLAVGWHRPMLQRTGTHKVFATVALRLLVRSFRSHVAEVSQSISAYSPSDSWPSRRSTLLQHNCALKRVSSSVVGKLENAPLSVDRGVW